MSDEAVKRKLTAILYADVAGYSRLVGEDEVATHRRLSAGLDLISERIESAGGRVVHYAGDAVLSEFASVVAAVGCAVDIQRSISKHIVDTLEDKRLQFRIGVNLGEVIIDRDDIYGDGVNVAARLESLAEPGGVCISGAVYDQVRGKLDVGVEDLGPRAVKNIAEPVHVYKVLLDPALAGVVIEEQRRNTGHWRWVVAGLALFVAAGAAMVWRPWATPPTEKVAAPVFPVSDDPSIAILPFDNLSGDPEQEYFADGLTEDLITDLSKISGLLVIARNSSFSYKGRNIDAKQVARELGVKYILEGSVRRIENQVRVNAQLIDGSTGGHLWAERYDERIDDIFALQDRVNRAVVDALKVKLTATDIETLEHQPRPVNLEAYEWLLKGRREFATLDQGRAVKAKEYFEQAIGADPGYARAYSNLGLYYWREWRVWGRDKKVNLEKAKTVGLKAFELDPESAVAPALLAVAYQSDGEHQEADKWGSEALRLKPTQAETLGNLGAYLLHAGRYNEAISTFSRAIRLDPQHPPIWISWLGHAYFMIGEFQRAIDVLNQGIARGPDYIAFHLFLAASYASLGELEKAEDEVQHVLRMNSSFRLSAYERYALGNTKNRSAVSRMVAALRKAGIPE